MRVRLGSPRRSFREMGRGQILFMALIFTVLGAGAMGIAGKLFADEIALNAVGVAARATVTETYVDTSRDSEGRARTIYRAKFTYVTEAGQSLQADRQIPKAWFAGLKKGDSLDVTYVPARPDVVHHARHAGLRPRRCRSV